MTKIISPGEQGYTSFSSFKQVWCLDSILHHQNGPFYRGKLLCNLNILVFQEILAQIILFVLISFLGNFMTSWHLSPLALHYSLALSSQHKFFFLNCPVLLEFSPCTKPFHKDSSVHQEVYFDLGTRLKTVVEGNSKCQTKESFAVLPFSKLVLSCNLTPLLREKWSNPHSP